MWPDELPGLSREDPREDPHEDLSEDTDGCGTSLDQQLLL